MNSLFAAVILAISSGDSRAWIPSHNFPSVHLPLSSSSSPLRPKRTFPPQRLVRTIRTNTAIQSTGGIASSEQEPLSSILNNIDDGSLPILHIGARIGSGTYGTVHNGYLLRSKTDIQSCVAKRAWTFPELLAGVPARANERSEKAAAAKTGLAWAKQSPKSKMVESSSSSEEEEEEEEEEEDAKRIAERCRHYWEVERHCFQKLETRKSAEKNAETSLLLEKAVPIFLGVYKDDGSGSGMFESIPGYGLLEEEKGGKSIGGWFSSNGESGEIDKSKGGHQWMVFECIKSVKSTESEAAEGPDNICALTLLDAMEMDWNGRNVRRRSNRNHLYGIQKAMGLPESCEFGDVSHY